MVTYEYRCNRCGDFETSQPLGTATQSVPCPTCAGDAARVWSPPLLNRTPAPLARALAREDASRDYPEVLDDLPPRRRRHPNRPDHPAMSRLPRL
jgi:putative FmdB family regulatory protein